VGRRHAPAALYSRVRPGTYCTGSWVVFRAGLDRCVASAIRTELPSPLEFMCCFYIQFFKIAFIIKFLRNLGNTYRATEYRIPEGRKCWSNRCEHVKTDFDTCNLFLCLFSDVIPSIYLAYYTVSCVINYESFK